MRAWRLAGSFDAGHIRGGTPNWEQELDFHQLEITGHAEQLESDYRLFREEFGLSLFRDGAWLEKTWPAERTYDWTYLDRLAAIGERQVMLTLCHYEWPRWLNAEDIWNGRIIDCMQELASAVATRYKGIFPAYVPVVESGYWTAMMTDWARWWPAKKNAWAERWWKLYAIVGRMLIAIARAVREADPSAEIALNEPWAWHPRVSLQDQARPFYSLLGRPDPVAVAETGTDYWGGDNSLLQIIGLNFYNNWGVGHRWPLRRLLLEARRQFPEKRIQMGETGNCHFAQSFSIGDWLHLVDEEVGAANEKGARVETVTWAPILTLGDFDWGKPAPGAWVTWDPDDPARKRTWDPETAKAICEYARADAANKP